MWNRGTPGIVLKACPRDDFPACWRKNVLWSRCAQTQHRSPLHVIAKALSSNAIHIYIYIRDRPCSKLSCSARDQRFLWQCRIPRSLQRPQRYCRNVEKTCGIACPSRNNHQLCGRRTCMDPERVAASISDGTSTICFILLGNHEAQGYMLNTKRQDERRRHECMPHAVRLTFS